jgi:GT2 family glycosyltransferase
MTQQPNTPFLFEERLPTWRSILRWGYHHLPLPIRTKRALWRKTMLVRGRLGGGIGRSIKIQLQTRDPETLKQAIQQLAFPPAPDYPEITILIPCYNQLGYTVACLESIAAHPPTCSYEVLVVDDASPDDDYTVLQSIPGLRLLQNPSNLGFLNSCNQAAVHARGRYLHFLNNDTVVLNGSIDTLHHTLGHFREAGLVGSKLLYPSGHLQEAGGIVWKDGSAWNYGKLQLESEPKFNYLRSVDYCSGASIMLPRSLFLDMGGFDQHYQPAYYEDTDLAMRIRALGKQVLYQPLSAVVHFEGISHGTDVNKGLKKHQVINKLRFQERWEKQLQEHRSNGEDADLEKDRGFNRRVLLIDKCTPSPDRDAGSVVLLNLMILLREMGYQPTFIPDDNYANLPPYTQLCQSLGIECLYAPHITSVKEHIKSDGRRYDLVILFRPDLTHCHRKTIRRYCPQAKLFYYPHDLHYLRLQREAELQQRQDLAHQANKSREIELANTEYSDSTIVLSLEELEILRKEKPESRIDHLPLILNEHSNPKLRPNFGGHNIVFIGSFNHNPNADAVVWFANEVLPLIQKQLADIHFHVVGTNPPAKIQSLQSSSITVHGFVEDLESLLHGMQAAVVPLRFGAGMKGKVGSAMRCGLPVITTSIGCEGMPVQSGIHLNIANTADTFAELVVRTLSEEDHWLQLSKKGLQFAKEQWGSQAAYENLRQILQQQGLTASKSDQSTINLYPFSNVDP